MTTNYMNNIKYGEINSIQFGLFGPEQISKYAVCEITNCKVHGENSVNDPRMGPIEDEYKRDTVKKNIDKKCITCNMDYLKCNGHFGFINLHTPVYHPEYLNRILDVLKCICSKCGRLLLSRKQLELNNILTNNDLLQPDDDDVIDEDEELFVGNVNKVVIKKIIEKCSTQDLCTAMVDGTICGYIQNSYSIVDDKIKTHYKKKDTSVNVSASHILDLFTKMTEDDMNILGFTSKYNHPKNMILTKLLVLPPCSRPPVFNGNIRSDDDFTFKYQEIIKSNIKLINATNGTDYINAEEALNFHIKTLFNNTKGKAKHNNGKGRPLKCFKQRLSGKKGQFRENHMGKRVDFSGRTVVTGDPYIKVDEIGVPKMIAQIESVRVAVTNINYNQVMEWAKQGIINAIINIDKDGNEILFNYKTAKVKPKIHPTGGCFIERELCNGDYVLANRQPTLHKPGMMGHKVRILPGKTFRFFAPVCTPYNADFDGDEVNVHFPQDVETMFDLQVLMGVKHNIISSQSNKPIIYPIQDYILGVYLLTCKRVEFKKHQRGLFNDILFRIDGITKWLYIKKVLGENHPDLYTGRILFSCILPDNFEFFKQIDTKDPNVEKNVVIKKGILLSGHICKQTVGGNANGIIHLLYKYYTPEITCNFINNICYLSNNYLLIHGFSVGIKDCIVQSNIANEAINKYTHEAEIIENSSISSALKEIKVNETLNNAKNIGQKIAIEELKHDNRLKNMIVCGSKGNYVNISQITSTLGNQNVGGKRLQSVATNYTRTCPYFKPFTTQPKSKGFVYNSFIKGLDPLEYYFHAMGGREGLVDTAVKTSDTGYTQHRIIKTFEDIKVVQDRTVRDNSGNIYQFNYGDDCLEPSKLIYEKNNTGTTWIDTAYLADLMNNKYENGLV